MFVRPHSSQIFSEYARENLRKKCGSLTTKGMQKSPKNPAERGVIILAAGLGKRMKSPLPKVLHEIAGEPMLFHLLSTLKNVSSGESVKKDASPLEIGIVVGHGREQVEKAVRENAEFKNLKITFLVQSEQKGTGHAARSAMDTPWGDSRVKNRAEILVLPGDLPLLPPRLVTEMLEPLGKGEVLRLLTCELPDPTGYGRVLRKGKGASRIVEEKDANEKQKLIREVAASIYTFQASFLKTALPKLTTKNAQGEYYLTDLIEFAAKKKQKMSLLSWKNPDDLRGINDLWELSLAEKTLQRRIIEAHARAGVRFLDPDSCVVERSVVIGEGVRIHRGVVLRGKTSIAHGSDIGSNCVLRSTRVGENVQMLAGCYSVDSEIGNEAKVGPYAHLRPESVVGSHAKIGNFVELKKAKIGAHTSIAHLSYVGDAVVGDRVNIGCGFITCNFDGRTINGSRKHQSIIEDDAFIGSDCQVVAPIRIGKGAYIASGSTVTKDVEVDALAIARSRQENKPGYAKKLRPSGKGE